MKRIYGIACLPALACLLPHPAFASMQIPREMINTFLLPHAAALLLVLISLFRGDNRTRILTVMGAVPIMLLLVLPLSLWILFLDIGYAAAAVAVSFAAALYWRAKPVPPTPGGNLNGVFIFLIALVLTGLTAFAVQKKTAQLSQSTPPAYTLPAKKPL